jgi:hypothetical protein
VRRLCRAGRPAHLLLLEKYYHSRGAQSCEEGRFNQAIRFFRKALALDDQAYTYANLALAYEGKSDMKRALQTISTAIKLSPSTAEYYLQRSRILQWRGEAEKAAEDFGLALKIDPDADRLSSIRSALEAIEEVFASSEEEFDVDLEDVHDLRLRALLAERAEKRTKRRGSVVHQSCIVPCPAFCCHFSKETLLHGLFFGSWKLHEVRQHLKERGHHEEEFLKSVRMGDKDRRLRLIPPDRMLSFKGQLRVYYPGRTGKALGRRLAARRPMGRGYRDISWITEKSRACAFLREGRCTIHDVGGDQALSSCKEFLCLTGFIFLVLHHLGLSSLDDLPARGMADLNRIAVQAALLISDHLFVDPRLAGMEKSLKGMIARALDADRKRELGACNKIVAECGQVKKEYDMRWHHQMNLLRTHIKGLMDRKKQPQESITSKGAGQ